MNHACDHCGKNLEREFFECPFCGKALISRCGVKAIRIIFWVLMGIWIFLCLQMESYSPMFADQNYQNATNVLWSLRANSLAFLPIAYALIRYWERKEFFPAVLVSFVFYLVTLWWAHHGFLQETANISLADNGYLVPRGIIAFMATAFAYFVSKERVDWDEESSPKKSASIA